MLDIIKSKCIKQHIAYSPWHKIPNNNKLLYQIQTYLFLLGVTQDGKRWELHDNHRSIVLVNSETGDNKGWWINIPVLQNYLTNQEKD